MPLRPTVSRIVHYISSSGSEHPAIVTDVFPGNEILDLVVFGEAGQGATCRQGVPYSEDRRVRSWHWPERDFILDEGLTKEPK